MDKVVLKSKLKLIKWLTSDWILILQHVQSNELITKSQYDELASMTIARDVVIKLLDIILGKGENVCRDFLNLLKDDDVNEFSPELREWIKTVDTSESAIMVRQSGTQVTSKISASDAGNVFSPIIAGSTLGSLQMNMPFAPSGKSNVPANVQNPDRNWERIEIQDYQKFLKANTSQLVQSVKNIDPVIDDLTLDLHNESIANVRANPTRQKKMRDLLDCVNCETIAKDVVKALFKHEPALMKQLQY